MPWDPKNQLSGVWQRRLKRCSSDSTPGMAFACWGNQLADGIGDTTAFVDKAAGPALREDGPRPTPD